MSEYTQTNVDICEKCNKAMDYPYEGPGDEMWCLNCYVDYCDYWYEMLRADK